MKETCTLFPTPYHFDDDFVEGLNPPNDVPTPLIAAQQGQCHPKENGNKYDTQHVHICGGCNNVVRYEVSQQLQECVYRGFCLWLVILYVPVDNLRKEAYL